MSNFASTQATYPFRKNTGFKSFDSELKASVGKSRKRGEAETPPPKQPEFQPLKPDYTPKFNGGKASRAIDRDELRMIKKRMVKQRQFYYN